MKKLLPLLALTALTACATAPMPAPAVRVEFRDRLVEVTKPCQASRPERPKPLAKPLPATAAQVIDLLAAKLTEWAGAGGYGDRADSALALCTKG